MCQNKQLNPFSRIQHGLRVRDLFPMQLNKKCACGCGNGLVGRQRMWFSEDCKQKSYQEYLVILGDRDTIRHLLYSIDQGACRHCGLITDTWEADHILPVYKGGGACSIENFQTLCYDCHKQKTYLDSREAHNETISLHDPLKSFSRCLKDLGERTIFAVDTSTP